MRQAPGAALVTALGTVTRPKNLAVALRALRFDFSDAPPVLGERGGQRSCSSLVWLGGGSGRRRRLRCRRSRGGVQTTRVRRKGCPRRRRARGESGAYKACGARQAGRANFFPRCPLVQLEVPTRA